MANWTDIAMKAEEIAHSNSKKYTLEDGECYCYSTVECKKSALDMAVWIENNRWNTAPKDLPLHDTCVLVYKTWEVGCQFEVMRYYRYGGKNRFESINGNEIINVDEDDIYWMQLPLRPKQTGTTNK